VLAGDFGFSTAMLFFALACAAILSSVSRLMRTPISSVAPGPRTYVVFIFLMGTSLGVAKTQQPRISGKLSGWFKRRPAPARESAAVLAPAGVAETPATPAKVKSPKKIKEKPKAAVTPAREFGEVLDWHNSRKIDRPAHKIRVQDCMADYGQWCQAMGKEVYSLTKFGIDMRDIVKAEKIERSKRTYYVGFALKAAALKVVSG
jgi:hypothetical protein